MERIANVRREGVGDRCPGLREGRPTARRREESDRGEGCPEKEVEGQAIWTSWRGRQSSSRRFSATATGIPVFKLTEEVQRLLRMEEELHRRVIGQEQAIHALSQAIRRTPGRV